MPTNSNFVPYNVRMGMMIALVTLVTYFCVIDDDENPDEFVATNQVLLIQNFADFVMQTVSHVMNVIDNGENDDTSIQQQPKRRRKASKWDWERARKAVFQDYTGPDPIFNDQQFERVFRISRSVMEKIRQIAGQMDDFFTEKMCTVTSKRTICPTAKILCGLKQIAYGVSPSAFQDYFQMGEVTSRQCMTRLASCIINNDELKQLYFRPMTRNDAIHVADLHKKVHGIEGMVGSLDCMHVTWKNCPVAWQGQYQGKEDGCTGSRSNV